MKRNRLLMIALVALMAVGCASEVDVEPTSREGKCSQERTEKLLGFIPISRSSFITNC